jgi:hypothetical protein
MKALVYPTSDSPKITIRHLLSHAEGFPEDNPWGDQQLADSDEQLSALIRAAFRSRTRRARLRVFQLRLRHPRPHRRQRRSEARRERRVTQDRGLHESTPVIESTC